MNKTRIYLGLVALLIQCFSDNILAAKPYDCRGISNEVMLLGGHQITQKPYQIRYHLSANEIDNLQRSLGDCPEEVLSNISNTPFIAVVCGQPVAKTYDLMLESFYHRQEGLGNILGNSKYQASKEKPKIYYYANICANFLDYYLWKVEAGNLSGIGASSPE